MHRVAALAHQRELLERVKRDEDRDSKFCMDDLVDEAGSAITTLMGIFRAA
jgi:hypothetical protein